jgi:hypothetical protein
MAVTSNKRGTSFLIIAVYVGFAIVLSCKNAPTTPEATLADFYVTTQVEGWVVDSTTPLHILPVDSLHLSIDGGYITYENAGLEKYFLEKLNGGPTHSPSYGDYNFSGIVQDYGTSGKVRTLFDTIVAHKMVQNVLDTFSDTVHLSQFSISEVQAKRVQGGVEVYATFGRYYFEFSLLGYVDPLTAAPDAVKFLTEYKALAK